MEIIEINEAAKRMHMSVECLRRRAKKGSIPADKPGKCWVFVREDLIAYIRSQYSDSKFIHSSKQIYRGKICHSTNVKEQKSGGSTLRRKA